MNMTKTKIALATAALMLSASVAVQAKIAPLDKVNVTLALAIPDSSTEISFDSNAGSEPIDFEKDIGLETDDIVASFGATWRPWDNHQFGLTYYNNTGERTREVNDLEWDGVVYDGTAKLETDLDAYDISYIWWWKNEDTWAFGPRVGLTYMQFNSNLDLLVDADGDPVVDESFDRDGNTDIPAPTIGAAWRWAFADNWRLKMDAGYMSAEIGDFDGDALILAGGVEWFPWENWGFSLNAARFAIDVNTAQVDFNGDLDYTLVNYTLGITYRF